jgi:allantoate deiminase
MAAVDPGRVVADLRELRQLTGDDDGAQRVAWTDTWKVANDWFREQLATIDGVSVESDAAGNLWATAPGDSERFVIIGGHLDSVPNGGWLDGILNVVAGLEVLRAQAGESRPLTLKLVSWADEEGARFGRSLLGSSAAAGTLEPDSVRGLTDRDGTALPDALRAHGVDLDSALDARASLEGAAAYLELHIEQGPVLESIDKPLGAVLGTFGVERHLAVFTGQAAHAGATPMELRRDSFAATAQAALAIREIGLAHEGGVCTVGGATSEPGVVTAVAGKTEMLLDQRSLDAGQLATMLDEARTACERAAADHGCELDFRHLWRIPPIPFDDRLIAIARESVVAAGGKDTAIPSGPLHDAAEMARLVPTVMIFSKSSPPVSHTPEEDTPEPDLRVAIEAYGRTVARALELVTSGEL